jgi:surface antigen
MNNRMVLVVGLLALAGCSTTGLGGASASLGGAGSAAGNQTGTTVISAMGGGLVSGPLGAGLSDSERLKGLEAEYKALEYTASGQTVTWRSDRSDRYGEVVAAQPYRVGSQDCRQYTHTVFTGGPGAKARGTACRNPDGSWTPLT